MTDEENTMKPGEEVLVDYTNWRGERRWRRIRPLRMAFENSEWHHETQWILHAVEVEMAANREFAMKDIHAWKPHSGAATSGAVDTP